MEIMKDIEVIRCKGSKICSPFVNKETGAVYYISAGTGEIFEYDNNHGEHKAILFTGGEPLGAQFDSNKTLHIADAAHAAVLRLEESGQPAIMVKSYEEKTFKVGDHALPFKENCLKKFKLSYMQGPSSIAFGPNGSLYFTDSGPFGETTFEKPHGSIFSIAQNPSGGQILRPLVLDSLAHPCGIATHPSDPKVV
jgi:aspartate beta-hydroxylase